MSVILALVGYFLLAFVFILDKFLLSDRAVKPIVYTFSTSFFLAFLLLLAPFIPNPEAGVFTLVAMMSGASYIFALWMMYRAVEASEASHINPFLGAVITIMTAVFGTFFLGESLKQSEWMAIVFLAVGSVLLSQEKSARHNGFHIGFVWALGSGLLFALYSVTAKFLYEAGGFLSGFVWSRGFGGILSLGILFLPAFWRAFKKPKKVYKKATRRRNLPLIVLNICLGVAAVVLLQFASSLGSVSIVNALSGFQYALMFVFIFYLSKFRSNWFHEEYSDGEATLELIGIFFIIIGTAILIV